MKPHEKGWRSHLVTGLCVVGGNLLLAFTVAAFVIPHDILMGGTTGIGIVLGKTFPAFDPSLFILILNVLLLLLGLVVLGKKFAATTVASSVLYPVFLGLIQRIDGIGDMTDNAVIAVIFAGIGMGLALGLVMRVGSSTGGTDIVALVLNRWLHLPVAVFVYLSDFLIIGGQAFFVPAEKTLLGIIAVFLEAIVLDQVMVLGKAQIQLFVISKEHEAVRDLLLTRLEAGVTMTPIETGMLGEQQRGVLCVIPQRKLYTATELIRNVDPYAFVTITQVREVHGRGFTAARKMLKLDRSHIPPHK